MSDMTISVSAEVEVSGKVHFDSARWEAPDTFLVDFAFDLKTDPGAGGVVVALSASDARRLMDAIREGLR